MTYRRGWVLSFEQDFALQIQAFSIKLRSFKNRSTFTTSPHVKNSSVKDVRDPRQRQANHPLATLLECRKFLPRHLSNLQPTAAATCTSNSKLGSTRRAASCAAMRRSMQKRHPEFKPAPAR